VRDILRVAGSAVDQEEIVSRTHQRSALDAARSDNGVGNRLRLRNRRCGLRRLTSFVRHQEHGSGNEETANRGNTAKDDG
jgi:hypothetical protein